MNVSPNIRHPCSGITSSNVIFIGGNGCFQSSIYNPSGSVISKSINTTKAKNYAVPYGSPINLYSRRILNNPAGDSCVPDDPNCCADYQTNNCQACGVANVTESLSGSNKDTVIYRDLYFNSFSQSQATIDNRCIPTLYGHKQIYGRKSWHGRYSYTSPNFQDNGDYFGSSDCAGDSQCTWLSPQTGSTPFGNVPDQTKYLSIYATINIVVDNGVTVTTSTAENEVHVDRYSGNIIVDVQDSGSNSSDPNAPANAWLWMTTNSQPLAPSPIFDYSAGNDHSFLLPLFAAWLENDLGIDPNPMKTTIGQGHYDWKFYITNSACDPDQPIELYAEDVLDYFGGTFTRTSYYAPNDDPCNWQLQNVQEWNFNGTNFYYNQTATSITAAFGKGSYTVSVTGQMAQSYTAGMAVGDAKTAMVFWNMDDNLQYPYRNDNSLVAPLCGYDEASPATAPIFTSTQIGNYSGNTLGAPLSYSYDHWWDSTHINWQTCTNTCGDGSTYTNWYTYTAGAWSDDSVNGCFVHTATNWLDLYTATQMYYGKWSGMNFMFTNPGCSGTPQRIYDDVIWLSDWREQKLPFPSLNFNRPCGQDRFDINEATSSCINEFSNQTVNVNSTYPFQVGDIVGICGTNTIDGIWPVVYVDSLAGNITVDNLMISASQVQYPPNVTCSFGPWIAALKWRSVPALCGRAYVISTLNGTCSLDRWTYLVDGDQVNTVPGGPQTVTVFSPTQIYLPISSSGQYLTSPFAPDWQWDDSTSKGDYVIENVTYQNRLVGEYSRLQAQSASIATDYSCDGSPCPPSPVIAPQQPYLQYCTQSCIATNPCSAPEIYKNIGIPTGVYDSLYGSLYQTYVVQYLDNPYWQPPLDCNGTYPFVEDPGNCIGNYCHRPEVEARCTNPPGSPPMLVSWGCNTDPACGPPQQGVFPQLAFMLANLMCECLAQNINPLGQLEMLSSDTAYHQVSLLYDEYTNPKGGPGDITTFAIDQNPDSVTGIPSITIQSTDGNIYNMTSIIVDGIVTMAVNQVAASSAYYPSIALTSSFNNLFYKVAMETDPDGTVSVSQEQIPYNACAAQYSLYGFPCFEFPI